MIDMRWAVVRGAMLCGVVFVTCSVTAQETPLDPEHAQRMTASLDLFKREVRTLFTGRCLKCHGGEKSEGEFSLATREALLQGGASGKAIEVGKSQASLLVRLISHEEEPLMPEDGAKLDQRQIDAIAKWIDLGAAYDQPLRVEDDSDELAWTRRTIEDAARDFWSFQPLRRVEPPQVTQASWGRTPIDAFILAQLEQVGIAANGPAARRKLVRRAYYDLIGLPPTPEEVEAFVASDDPQAYEQLIDRLLESPHYGERVGRHWLDVARFAESHGFEQDYDRPHAYPYRDFVIRALNDDMPFDQFARWQIAGDEYEPENPLALMATGFLGAGVFPTQLTEKEFESSRYDELDDMVATMGTAFMGLTVGCARCHDHKFDPIPARDYYQLISAFRTTIRSNIEIDLDPASTRAALAKWEQELKPFQDALQAFESSELPGRFASFITQQRATPPAKSENSAELPPWITLAPTSLESTGGATFVEQGDGSFLATGSNADSDTYVWVTETVLPPLTSFRLEALADDSLKQRGPGRAANGNVGLSRIRVQAQPLDGSQKPVDVKLINPRATFQQNAGNLSIAAALDDDPKSGWAVDPQFGQNHAAAFDCEQPIGFPGGTRYTIRLEFQVNQQHNIGRLRIAASVAATERTLDAPAGEQWGAELASLQLPETGELNDAQQQALLAIYKKTDSTWKNLHAAVQQHLASRPAPKLTTVMVSSEGVKPIPNHGDGRGFPHFYKDAFFLKRGDVNQKQGIAEEGFLQVLLRGDESTASRVPDVWRQPPPEGSQTSYRRRALAEWLTDQEHGAGHLLARVIVNRIWQQHLGTGIVATPNDFGFQGERPTHPELLDWLATELVRGGWRLKPIHKLIMTSTVYQQDAEYVETSGQIDPNNRLYWRFAPRRLESEIIRDSMLSVSQQLDPTQFGPGTLNEAMRRRSIYFMIKRSQLIPFLQVFDTPEPLVSVGQRPSTTIAPQALVFMNSPLVRGYATAFAERTLRDANESDESSVERGYEIALAREPTAEERQDAVAFVQQQADLYTKDGLADPRRLAMADFCQVLMSLSEFIYID